MNNRQNGRRRGRGGGGQPPRGQSNGPDRGSRIDNRARGNASQLYEKYKSLARDSQMQGDRVTTEYYLQFADHYFRVLNENRARFEEQRPRRDDLVDGGDQRDDFDDDMFDESDNALEQQQPSRQPETARDDRNRDDRNRDHRDGNRDERGRNDGNRDDRPRDDRNRDDRNREERRPRREQPPRPEVIEQPIAAAPPAPVEAIVAPMPSAPVNGEVREERSRRRRPRNANNGEAMAAPVVADAAPERIDIDRLPPAFAAERAEPVPANDGGTAEEKPRVRRPRRPRGEGAAVAVDA